MPLFLLSPSVCNLACENGGTVNKGACTCNCVGGFSGATCGGELRSALHAWGAETDIPPEYCCMVNLVISSDRCTTAWCLAPFSLIQSAV